MADAKLPSLANFPAESFDPARGTTDDQLKRHRELSSALLAWMRSATGFDGLEAGIEELNRHGHAFETAPCGSPGWVIFRESLPGGEHDLQISATREDDGEIMLTMPMSDGAWERQLRERRESMTDEEREADRRRERFYERGGALFVERSDDWDSLDAVDRMVMSLYTVDTEVNNGGFAQYFTNTGGRQAKPAARFLDQIGAPRAAVLLRRAIEAVGPPFGEELSDAQWNAIDREAESLGALDDAYYALDEDIALLAMRWVEPE